MLDITTQCYNICSCYSLTSLVTALSSAASPTMVKLGLAIKKFFNNWGAVRRSQQPMFIPLNPFVMNSPRSPSLTLVQNRSSLSNFDISFSGSKFLIFTQNLRLRNFTWMILIYTPSQGMWVILLSKHRKSRSLNTLLAQTKRL